MFRKPSYLIRFDDICPTMNWAVWDRLERILGNHDIKPILAVVPDNRDPKLIIDKKNTDFWDRVRSWQERDWGIALHGYQHVYETDCCGLLGINRHSEFAGLAYDVQRYKIERGLSIFAEHGIHADAWVAPGHAFDETTVRILVEFGIRVISDGFYWRPVVRLGALWIPQQMWRFRTMPWGIWTICYHHNWFSEEDIRKIEDDIVRNKQAISSLDDLIGCSNARDMGMVDVSMSNLWLAGIKLKRGLSRLGWIHAVRSSF